MFRKVLTVPWLVFVAWMAVYGMVVSALLGLVGGWALWPTRRVPGPDGAPAPRNPRTRVRAVVLAVGLAAVPLVGLPEYAATTNRLHCRTLGFMGSTPPKDCRAADLAEGRRVARAGGPLYTPRERLGVHGFNHLLALGGFAAFLPEVAWETLWMSWAPDPFAEEGGAPRAPLAARRAQCSASKGTPGHRLAPARQADGDVAARSPKVRRMVADGLPRLGRAPGSTVALGPVHFIGKGSNLEAYAHAFVHDSLRAALALEVDNSRISLHRQTQGVEARWTGTVHYPGDDRSFEFPFPSVTGPPFMLRVSEAIFCGMQVDGAMNPYVLVYTWPV